MGKGRDMKTPYLLWSACKHHWNNKQKPHKCHLLHWSLGTHLCTLSLSPTLLLVSHDNGLRENFHKWLQSDPVLCTQLRYLLILEQPIFKYWYKTWMNNMCSHTSLFTALLTTKSVAVPFTTTKYKLITTKSSNKSPAWNGR